MSYYVADVGEVIIKPEYRKDFGHFFRDEFDLVEREPLRKFANEIVSYPFCVLSKINEQDPEVLRRWAEKNETRYEKDTGLFVYACKGEESFCTEILPAITEEVFIKETLTHKKTFRIPDAGIGSRRLSTSVYFYEVGTITVKPEYREDFDFFFHGQYSRLQTKLLKDFVYKGLKTPRFTGLRYWKHNDEKEEWHGRYKTSYDESSGRFVYGVFYNKNRLDDLTDFLLYILPEITETEISSDCWSEDMEEEIQ